MTEQPPSPADGHLRWCGSARCAGAELGLSLGQALHRTFHLYARKQIGQGRFQYDVDNPRLNDSQLMKMCQDAGLVEPQGEA